MAGRMVGPGTARAFLSMGTAESSSGEVSSNVYWQDAVRAYDDFARGGHAANRGIQFVGVAGGQHNEPAWSRLLPQFFSWALHPWREANLLTMELHAPGLRLAESDHGRMALQRTTLHGFAQSVLTSGDLAAWTTNTVTNSGEAWDAVTHAVLPGDRQFWRLRTDLP
jgi:hypothetical protein